MANILLRILIQANCFIFFAEYLFEVLFSELKYCEHILGSFGER